MRAARVQRAQLFRNSFDAPALWSCEWHVRNGGGWNFERKEDGKYQPTQIHPPGARHTVIEGVDCFTMHAMTTEEIEEHRETVRRLRNRLCAAHGNDPSGWALSVRSRRPFRRRPQRPGA